MKSARKMISVVLALLMLISVLSIASISVNALSRTQNEAVSWANSQVGQALDYDGAYGAQCVDLIMYYYQYLGARSPGGNGKDYAGNSLPDGWIRTSSPQPGDIAVWTDGDWGHVAIVTELRGSQMVCVEQNYAGKMYVTPNLHSINAQTYIHPAFNGNPDPQNNPISALDSVEGRVGSVYVGGWTFDKDDLSQSLSVHVYIGGSAGSPNAEGIAIPANASRKDVDNVYHVGEFHGFDTVIPTSKSGNQDIYVYAINIGGGENTEIGHKTVYISPDTEKPTCNTSYLSQVTQNSFRVCAVPNDNVGIKEVRIATWTQSDQSDLIWHTANFNGSDTYFVNVNRSDYSNNKNSLYYNHIYVYDYAGNYISIACNQDYKLSSDTGKSVPEGEYRIATAVNENRALDVENGSADSGANIQIYANFISPKQTFNISYLNNGFYTIANSFSGLVLDVAGDTYVNNTNVMQHTSNGGANQEWMIEPSGDGYCYIISRTNGLALDVTNADDRDGANVAVHTQNQSYAQKWKLRRVIKDDMVTITDWMPKGGIYQPIAKVVVDGQTLTKDVDYTVSTFIDNEILYAKINGIGNYCDSVVVEYKEPEQTVTNKPTEPSTVKPTEPVTDKPTDGNADPTEPATANPTDDKTDPTEPATAKPTDGKTDPTEPVTGKPIEVKTDPTEPATDKPTEPLVTEPKPTTPEPTSPVVEPAENKKDNPVKVTAKTKTVKLKKLKKKAQKVQSLTIKSAKGKVSIKITGAKKAIKKYLKFNSKGTLTIKRWKQPEKGTYKIKVKITVKGNSKYKPITIKKTVKIKLQ